MLKCFLFKKGLSCVSYDYLHSRNCKWLHHNIDRCCWFLKIFQTYRVHCCVFSWKTFIEIITFKYPMNSRDFSCRWSFNLGDWLRQNLCYSTSVKLKIDHSDSISGHMTFTYRRIIGFLINSLLVFHARSVQSKCTWRGLCGWCGWCSWYGCFWWLTITRTIVLNTDLDTEVYIRYNIYCIYDIST